MDPEILIKKAYLIENQLLAFAKYLTKNSEDAADLLQDAYERMLNCAHQVSECETNSGVKAWLICVIKTTFLNQVDKNNRAHKNKAEYINSLPTTTIQAHNDTLPRALEIALNSITTEQRDMIQLYANGFSYPEIAKLTGRNYCSVKQEIYNGRQIARRKLRGKMSL